MGFAAALKIFPLIGYVSFVRKKVPYIPKGAILGLIFSLPLLLPSLLEIPDILQGTVTGFSVAYGLTSIKAVPYLLAHPMAFYVTVFAYICVFVGSIIFLAKSGPINRSVASYLESLGSNDVMVFIVSSAIFVTTFFISASWSYRLIFLIPSFLILARSRSAIAKWTCLNILLVFWVPTVPYGWSIENLLCFPLAISMSFLLAKAIGTRLRSEG